MLKFFQHLAFSITIDPETTRQVQGMVQDDDYGLWKFHWGITSNYFLPVQRTSYTKNILGRHVGIDHRCLEIGENARNLLTQ